MKIRTTYFYGNKVNPYGLENGFVDYGTLAKAFDAVLVNDITKLFFNSIGGEYIEPEQVNGTIDNSEEIEALEEERDAVEDEQIALINNDLENSAEYTELEARFDELTKEIERLEDEQHNEKEIFQYYIISDSGARILQDWTNELVYYIPVLDVYVWGVTHWGTSWDYVLTDIEIDLTEEGATV